ncbi:MAG: hypothetical protein M0O96_02180 [Desulforhopalus sp.]|nr:hypothetical protein [Desulforhopalus sp.]
MPLTTRQCHFLPWLKKKKASDSKTPSLRKAGGNISVSNNAVAWMFTQLERRGLSKHRGACCSHTPALLTSSRRHAHLPLRITSPTACRSSTKSLLSSLAAKRRGGDSEILPLHPDHIELRPANSDFPPAVLQLPKSTDTERGCRYHVELLRRKNHTMTSFPPKNTRCNGKSVLGKRNVTTPALSPCARRNTLFVDNILKNTLFKTLLFP